MQKASIVQGLLKIKKDSIALWNHFRVVNSRLGMSVTTQGGSGRQSITGS